MRSYKERLKDRNIEHMPLVTGTPMALGIDHRNLTNSVNRDEGCRESPEGVDECLEHKDRTQGAGFYSAMITKAPVTFSRDSRRART
jgi:hypothetical protein